MGELIYILGCNGSGTTLLQNLFRCARNTKVINGEVPPPILFRAEQSFGDPELSFVGKRCGATHLWGSSLGGVDAALINSPRMVSDDVLHEGREDIIPWVEWMAGWRRIWHIHMRRDPRDSLTSAAPGLERHVREPYMWKNAERVYERIHELNPSRTLAVKYEELTADPNAIMDQLLKIIGLEKELSDVNDWPKTLSKQELSHPSMKWLGRPRKVDAERVGRWKENQAQVKKLLQTDPDLADLLVKCGYDEKGWEKKL